MPSTDPQQPSWGRRLGAVVVDWFLSILVVAGVTGETVWDPDSPSWVPFAVLGAFVVMRALLDGLLGWSIGHRVAGLAVVRADGGPVGARALVRTLLICLVVPPFVIGRDGRSLHDVVSGTALVRA